jgi:hypothetical protein
MLSAGLCPSPLRSGAVRFANPSISSTETETTKTKIADVAISARSDSGTDTQSAREARQERHLRRGQSELPGPLVTARHLLQRSRRSLTIAKSRSRVRSARLATSCASSFGCDGSGLHHHNSVELLAQAHRRRCRRESAPRGVFRDAEPLVPRANRRQAERNYWPCREMLVAAVWFVHAQSGFSAEREIAEVPLRSRRAANEDSAIGDKADLALGREGEEVASPIPIVEVKCALVPLSGPPARSRKSLARREQAQN